MSLNSIPARSDVAGAAPAVPDADHPTQWPRWRRLRLWQMRRGARAMRRLARLPGGSIALRIARTAPPLAWLLNGLGGHFRAFPTLAAAAAAAEPYAEGGHDNPENAALHLRFADTLRPSDYPALFHLLPHAAALSRVFDAGGNVGNLYYAYARHLPFRPDLAWIVQDLPSLAAVGARIAAERGDRRLRFTTAFDGAADADLLIACGSLHYFEEPLPDRLARLRRLPPRVLINRTPLTDGPSVATVQDGGVFQVACRLYNRAALRQGFARLGYRVVDEWPVPELSLVIPAWPESSAWTYSGMLLEQSGRAPAPA